MACSSDIAEPVSLSHPLLLKEGLATKQSYSAAIFPSKQRVKFVQK